MKKTKITSVVLAAAMTMSSAYSLAFAQDSEAVYTYRNENGETITITQAQLDAWHWNVDALGDTLPIIYEKFPMSIETFVNDLAEVSLSIEYMKKIEDMDSVTLCITDVSTGTDVYNDEITNYSFYSPNLEPGKQYEMHLVEVLNGETTDYGKAVSVNKVTSPMNEAADFSDAEDDTKILVGDTDALRAGMTTDEDGKLVINTATAKYERVTVGGFYDYIDTMPENKTYRLYMTNGDEQYEGFISTSNRREIYTYEASVIDLVAPCADASVITQVRNLNYSDVANITTVELTDASCIIGNTTNLETAYAAFEIEVPTDVIDDYFDNGSRVNFEVYVKGDSAFEIKSWENVCGRLSDAKTTPSTNANNAYISYSMGSFNYPTTITNRTITIRYIVYFPTTVAGALMFDYRFYSGYTDDVTGSINDVYNATSPNNLTNTEYMLTDCWDVDAFHIETSDAGMFKVELKNRSIAHQELLDSGQYAAGGKEKRVIGWTVGPRGSVNVWEEWVVYTVAKNTDLVFYKAGADDPNVITVRHKPNVVYASDPYQLSYQFIPETT